MRRRGRPPSDFYFASSSGRPVVERTCLLGKESSFAFLPTLKGRVAESNFCGTPLLQTNQEKNGGIASKSNQPKPKKV
jgi:hypothetical protein